MEIIKVTQHDVGTDIFQVMERAADLIQNVSPAVARSFTTGDKVQIRPTAKTLEEMHNLADDITITFGDGPDAQLSSDGTSFVINNGAGTETMLKATQNAAVELYYNNLISGITTAQGMGIYDTSGNLPKLFLYRSDTTQAGQLVSDDGDVALQTSFGTAKSVSLLGWDGAADDNLVVGTQGGAVDLYYDGNKKFETSNTGATITGILVADGLTLGDNEDITLGAGPDAKISSNGTALVIENGAGTETMLTATQNGAIDLYYDNVNVFSTVTGGVAIKDGVSAGATIVWSDDDLLITNDDQYGAIELYTRTFAGVQLAAQFGGNLELYYAGILRVKAISDGLQIHNSDSYYFSCDFDTAVLNLRNATGPITYFYGDYGTVTALANSDGEFKLYYDGSATARTIDDGWEILSTGTGKGCLTLPEIATPTVDANTAKIYTKADNELYVLLNGVEKKITVT